MITDYLQLYSRARRQNKELQMRIIQITSKYEAEVLRLKNELLRPQVKFTSKMDDFAKVVQSVCIVCDVTPAQLLGISRVADIKDGRHMLVYIMRHHYGLKYSEIGRRLGRDHSTVINSYQTMTHYLQYDKVQQKIYNTVKELLGICN
jgi:chromosomal replication initiation ATPase DnaA